MTNYFFTFFISGAATAGMAVLWRTLLLDHPNFNAWLKGKWGLVGHALTCGSCFTYWLALAFTLICHPISFWMPFAGNGNDAIVINVLLQWMALSWIGLFLRFLYVAVQELVHYQMHYLRDGHKH